MTPTETVTAVGVFLALLWNVLNEIRLRDHAKTLQTSEAHLRVRAEIQLRLHEQALSLLRETHEAAFPAYDTIRNYAMAAIVYERSPKSAIPLWGDEYQKTMLAVQKFSALAHMSPPTHQILREAASGFSKAFNLVNESLLGGAPPSQQHALVMKAVTDALGQAALGTKEWNEELWQHQTVDELAPVPKSLTPAPKS